MRRTLRFLRPITDKVPNALAYQYTPTYIATQLGTPGLRVIKAPSITNLFNKDNDEPILAVYKSDLYSWFTDGIMANTEKTAFNNQYNAYIAAGGKETEFYLVLFQQRQLGTLVACQMYNPGNKL